MTARPSFHHAVSHSIGGPADLSNLKVLQQGGATPEVVVEVGASSEQGNFVAPAARAEQSAAPKGMGRRASRADVLGFVAMQAEKQKQVCVACACVRGESDMGTQRT